MIRKSKISLFIRLRLGQEVLVSWVRIRNSFSKPGGFWFVSTCRDRDSRSRHVSKSWSRQPWKSRQFQPSLNRISINLCPKISICLNSWHDLDLDSRSRQFSKSVSTCWDVSISILIGLDCRDPQAYHSDKLTKWHGKRLSQVECCWLKPTAICQIPTIF